MWRVLFSLAVLLALSVHAHAGAEVELLAGVKAVYSYKLTFVSSGWSMSALPPKADIRQRIEHVR